MAIAKYKNVEVADIIKNDVNKYFFGGEVNGDVVITRKNNGIAFPSRVHEYRFRQHMGWYQRPILRSFFTFLIIYS